MAGSASRKRLVAALLAGTAILGVLVAGYVGTPTAWVTLLEVLGFLAVAVAAAMASPSLDDLSEPRRKPPEQD